MTAAPPAKSAKKNVNIFVVAISSVMRSLPGSAKAIRDSDHVLELFGVMVIMPCLVWIAVCGGMRRPPAPLVALALVRPKRTSRSLASLSRQSIQDRRPEQRHKDDRSQHG